MLQLKNSVLRKRNRGEVEFFIVKIQNSGKFQLKTNHRVFGGFVLYLFLSESGGLNGFFAHQQRTLNREIVVGLDGERGAYFGGGSVEQGAEHVPS